MDNKVDKLEYSQISSVCEDECSPSCLTLGKRQKSSLQFGMKKTPRTPSAKGDVQH